MSSEVKKTQQHILRAMAMNYAEGHAWDRLDSEACAEAADEIAALEAECERLRSGVKTAAYMELDTTKRSIAIQDELRAMLSSTPAQPTAQTHASRDWAEDFDHENGCYSCLCSICKQEFTGHKRRVVCKGCSQHIPAQPAVHPDNAAVDRFAAAMKDKLAKAREKGRSGWNDPAQCSVEFLAKLLVEHLSKGNDGTFEDVANFAMMLHQRDADPQVLAAAASPTQSEKVAHSAQWPTTPGLSAGPSEVQRLREALERDTDYRDGLAAGWNFGVADDIPGYQRSLSSYNDQIREARAALAASTGQEVE